METQLVQSPDGTMIAYDVMGEGPAVILLHDFNDDRSIWHDHLVTQPLSAEFTVITLDMRGCGDSEQFDTPGRYSLKATLEDVLAVASACNLPHFMLWGWSFGGTVALQLAARFDHASRVVAAGTFFGKLFNESYVQSLEDYWRQMRRLKQAGALDELDPDDAEFVAETNIPVLLARLEAMKDWPPVDPAQLMCPALMLTGTEDDRVVVKLREQRPAMEAAGVEYRIFDGMDHVGLLDDVGIVLPVVTEFLRQMD